MSNSKNSVAILNTIRNNATENYKTEVPKAELLKDGTTNISKIGNAILSYDVFTNEFVSALINRIAFTLITNKIAKNRLETLKKGKVPLGTDIQDIISNPAKASPYDKTDFSSLLRDVPVDTKAIYYRRNRQDKYQVTLFYDGLKGAFVDERNFMDYIASVVNTLYSGNFIDEYELTKGVLTEGYETNKFITYEISDYTEDSLKNVIKEVRADFDNFSIPSSDNNKFAEVYKTETGVDVTPVVSWCDREDQIIIIESAFLARLGVDVLASQFNLSEVEFRERMLVVDNFGYTKRTGVQEVNGVKQYITEKVVSPLKMVHCDRGLFQIYDNMFKFTTDYNGGNLAWQYWLHCWQTYALRLWANCKMYYYSGEDSTTPTPTPTQREISVTNAEYSDQISAYIANIENSDLTLKLTTNVNVSAGSEKVAIKVNPAYYHDTVTPTLSTDGNIELSFSTYQDFVEFSTDASESKIEFILSANGYKETKIYFITTIGDVKVEWENVDTLAITEIESGIPVGYINNFNLDAYNENHDYFRPIFHVTPVEGSQLTSDDISSTISEQGEITIKTNLVPVMGDKINISVDSTYYHPDEAGKDFTITE